MKEGQLYTFACSMQCMHISLQKKVFIYSNLFTNMVITFIKMIIQTFPLDLFTEDRDWKQKFIFI